jgi:hypothetical protein
MYGPELARGRAWTPPQNNVVASTTVIAITKCPIPAPTVNEFTPSLRAARKCARTSDYVMETIMSKTNHTSYGAAATSELGRAKLENRVLADSELDAVSGGRLLEAATKGKVFKQVEIHGTA